MGRKANDGRGRIGGRAKGTQNKPQKPLDLWALEVINRNRAQLEKDLPKLTPEARAFVLVHLAGVANSMPQYLASMAFLEAAGVVTPPIPTECNRG